MMELPRNYIQCERAREGISHLVSGRMQPYRKNASIENSSVKSTFPSFCSEPFEPSTRVLFAGKPEYTPSCDQLSKIESTVECRGEIKSNFPSGIHQMSSFERACYEDFQTYIPEITPETQFVYTSKLCEDNGTVYGRVSPSRPAVNHNNVLTHYPSSSSHKVMASARHCFYNEGVESLACEAKRNVTSTTLGNCKVKDAAPSPCTENSFSRPQEMRPGLPENLRFSKSAYSRSIAETSQAPPNKAVNHFSQPLCPTVSIRVDISCPLSSCNCDKMSCCCRDAHPKSPVRHSYGSRKTNNVAFRPSAFQSIPRAVLNSKTNSFTNEFSYASAYSNGYTTDLSKCQLKSECFPEANFKSFHQRVESPANINGCSQRLNNHMFNMNRDLQNGSCMTDDRMSCQQSGSASTEKKFTFQNTRGETLNASAVKYDEKMRWSVNYTQPENFSLRENSCIVPEKHVQNMNFPKGSQIYPKEIYFPKTVINSYHDGRDLMECVELTPVNPRKIFGQCRFQTTGNSVHVEEKYSYAEPSGQKTTWPSPCNLEMSRLQAETPANMRNKRMPNESFMVIEPSSPIANLSNLVAKIHPDHGNIMTGKKNPKLEGKLI